jgi:uncharacterized protein YuzB (UPF0349 family)
MLKIIEFCVSNAQHGTDETMRRCAQHPAVDTIEYGCLGNCGQCYLEPFALVDGVIISDTTAEELFKRIMEAVDAEPEDPYANLPLD